MPRLLLRAWIFAAVLALVLPGRAAAFEYDEHCVVSNAALRAALLEVNRSRAPAGERPAGRLADSTVASLLRFTEGSPCKERDVSRITFGDWVALGDFALQPLDYFLYARNDEAWSQFLAGTVPEDVIQRLGASYVQLMYASQNNQDHFGDRGMFVFAFWHRAALREAEEGRTHVALLMEAFALHFLQDHLAPGHIRTSRRGLHSVFSLGVHDRYNRRGEWYFPRHVDELVRFIPPGTGPGDTGLLGDWKGACPAQPDARRCLASLDSIRLHGDFRLHQEPAQRLFMVPLMARAITDVLDALDAGRVGEGGNHFAEHGWTGWNIGGDGVPNLPTGAIRYGSYGEPAEDSHLFLSRNDRILTPTLGFQAPLTHDRPATATLALEWPVIYWPGDGHVENYGGFWAGKPQTLLHLGVDASWNPRQWSFGPSARVIWPETRVGGQFSVSPSLRALTNGDGPLKVAPRVEVRNELGFGIAFVGIGVAWEPFLAPDGHVRRGVTLTSTFTPTLIKKPFRHP
jgi:hypothetical protein